MSRELERSTVVGPLHTGGPRRRHRPMSLLHRVERALDLLEPALHDGSARNAGCNVRMALQSSIDRLRGIRAELVHPTLDRVHSSSGAGTAAD